MIAQAGFCHLPYLPFPETWPIFIPALKLADWLEFYARTLEIDVWNSSAVVSASRNKLDTSWTIRIDTGNGIVRTFDRVPHLIIAAGIGSDCIRPPSLPGDVSFIALVKFGAAPLRSHLRVSSQVKYCTLPSMKRLRTIRVKRFM